MSKNGFESGMSDGKWLGELCGQESGETLIREVPEAKKEYYLIGYGLQPHWIVTIYLFIFTIYL